MSRYNKHQTVPYLSETCLCVTFLGLLCRKAAMKYDNIVQLLEISVLPYHRTLVTSPLSFYHYYYYRYCLLFLVIIYLLQESTSVHRKVGNLQASQLQRPCKQNSKGKAMHTFQTVPFYAVLRKRSTLSWQKNKF